MSSEQLLNEIKATEKGIKQAQKRVEAREDALKALQDKWAVETAAAHGIVIGQKRFIKPMNKVSVVKEIYYYNDTLSYRHYSIQRVFIGFEFSLLDPVHLATALRDSDVVTEEASQ